MDLRLNEERERLIELERRQLELKSNEGNTWVKYKNLDFSLSQRRNSLEDLHRSLIRLRKEYDDFQRRIEALNIIINSPAPVSRIERKCIYGHINCPNLPNDVVGVVNQLEVDTHCKSRSGRERKRAIRARIISS